MSGLDIDIALNVAGFSLQARHRFAARGVTAIFGPSGSGKSTLLRCIAGLEPGVTGQIRMGAQDWLGPQTRTPPEARGLGYVFQDARLFPHLTVAGNLRFADRRARHLTGPDLAEVVALLDLAPLLRRWPSSLSGGERQRAAIGRALLSRPRLLLMDEPLAALDDTRKAEILTHLERMRDVLGLPILYVSHSIDEVARLADHIVLLNRGRITAAGPVDQLLSDPALVPSLGPRLAGAVLTAQVVARHGDGLTELATSAGRLFVPQLAAAAGTPVRLRIPAQDIILARNHPGVISALNVLPAIVTRLQDAGADGVSVGLLSGRDRLLARLTHRSALALALEPGVEVFAITKSVAIAREHAGETEMVDSAAGR